jgi:hypothetical protein
MQPCQIRIHSPRIRGGFEIGWGSTHYYLPVVNYQMLAAGIHQPGNSGDRFEVQVPRRDPTHDPDRIVPTASRSADCRTELRRLGGGMLERRRFPA